MQKSFLDDFFILESKTSKAETFYKNNKRTQLIHKNMEIQQLQINHPKHKTTKKQKDKKLQNSSQQNKGNQHQHSYNKDRIVLQTYASTNLQKKEKIQSKRLKTLSYVDEDNQIQEKKTIHNLNKKFRKFTETHQKNELNQSRTNLYSKGKSKRQFQYIKSQIRSLQNDKKKYNLSQVLKLNKKQQIIRIHRIKSKKDFSKSFNIQEQKKIKIEKYNKEIILKNKRKKQLIQFKNQNQNIQQKIECKIEKSKNQDQDKNVWSPDKTGEQLLQNQIIRQKIKNHHIIQEQNKLSFKFMSFYYKLKQQVTQIIRDKDKYLKEVSCKQKRNRQKNLQYQMKKAASKIIIKIVTKQQKRLKKQFIDKIQLVFQ